MPPDSDQNPPDGNVPQPPIPTTRAEWRALLIGSTTATEFDDIPRRKRRGARSAWKSARKEQREAWIKQERKKTPTGPAIPIVALVVASAVLTASWLWQGPSDRTPNSPTAPTPVTSTAQAIGQATGPVPEKPAAPAPETTTAPPLSTPNDVARAFITAYSTRIVLQDGSHTGAVKRAAPYASEALIENLTRHDDLDFNQLVALQATEAHATAVTIALPTAQQRPAPDTDVRVYRQAVVSVAVAGPDPTAYTRQLTVEVSRADTNTPWMVTRVIGIEE